MHTTYDVNSDTMQVRTRRYERERTFADVWQDRCDDLRESIVARDLDSHALRRRAHVRARLQQDER